MNAIEACRQIDVIASQKHRQQPTLINAIAPIVKTMVYNSDFYESDIVEVFRRFCETGILNFQGLQKAPKCF